jgi:transcription initiation factor TFIIIB Brf1 subunit/transcription initiation factor TFIIB
MDSPKTTKTPPKLQRIHPRNPTLRRKSEFNETRKTRPHYINNTPHLADVKLVTAHINKLLNILESSNVITNHYASILSKYAIEMIHAEQTLLKGHRPDLVAASALFAADRLIAEYFTLRVFAKFTDVGAGNLSAFAETFKRHAPPVPKESAAIYFTENLFRRIF